MHRPRHTSAWLRTFVLVGSCSWCSKDSPRNISGKILQGMAVCNGWLWCVDLFGSHNVSMLICGCSLTFFVLNCRFYAAEVVLALEYLHCKGEWNWIFKSSPFSDFTHDYLVFFLVFLTCSRESSHLRSNLPWLETREHPGDRERTHTAHWLRPFLHHNTSSAGSLHTLILNSINTSTMLNVQFYWSLQVHKYNVQNTQWQKFELYHRAHLYWGRSIVNYVFAAHSTCNPQDEYVGQGTGGEKEGTAAPDEGYPSPHILCSASDAIQFFHWDGRIHCTCKNDMYLLLLYLLTEVPVCDDLHTQFEIATTIEFIVVMVKDAFCRRSFQVKDTVAPWIGGV